MPLIRSTLRGLFATAVVLSLNTAHAAPELFYGPDKNDIPDHVNLPAQALNGHYIRINHDLFKERGLKLKLPNGQSITAGLKKFKNLPNGSQTWTGDVVGSDGGSVIMSRHGQAVAGVIRQNGKLFKIFPAGNGVHGIVEVSPNEPYPELEPQTFDAYSSSNSSTTVADGTASDDGSQIDVMVAYSSNTKNIYNGVDGVNALIATAIAESNQAYINSGINTQLRLVHTVEVQNTTGSFSSDLNALTNPSDGVIDYIHDLRDQYGADMVTWFNEAPSYCGMAWVNKGDLSQDAGRAFSVVASDCATGYYSTAHELGHNMGSMHDEANSGSSGVFPYSFGYQDPQSSFRTVMAYNCQFGCVRRQFFSNPDRTFNGKPTGSASANNASSINQTRVAVSQWRTSSVNPTPTTQFGANCSDLSCDFSVTSSTGNIVSWNWDFGDGNSSTSPAPQHNFASAGTYSVSLMISDDTGATGSDTKMVTVTESPVESFPPESPSGLAVTNDANGKALLSWIDNSDNETQFEIQRQNQHPKNRKWVGSTMLSTPADTDYLTDSAGAGNFRYQVRAVNGSLVSNWTSWQTVTITESSGGNTSGGKGNGRGKKK